MFLLIGNNICKKVSNFRFHLLSKREKTLTETLFCYGKIISHSAAPTIHNQFVPCFDQYQQEESYCC